MSSGVFAVVVISFVGACLLLAYVLSYAYGADNRDKRQNAIGISGNPVMMASHGNARGSLSPPQGPDLLALRSVCCHQSMNSHGRLLSVSRSKISSTMNHVSPSSKRAPAHSP